MGTTRRMLIVCTLCLPGLFAARGQVTLQWAACYNGPANYWDTGMAITVDDSGYVYVTGASVGVGTNEDYATVKYNPTGGSVWVRRWSGPGNQFDLGRAILPDRDGNVYVTGAPVTLKYNATGQLVWESDNGAQCVRIEIDTSGDIYVAGTGFGDFVTRKLSPSGAEIWKRTYNGPANSSDRLHDMVLDSQGNVIVTGQSHGIGTHWDYATIKYSPDGDMLWVRRYNGPAPTYPGDYAYAITVDDSDNVYVTGWSDGANERPQCFTIKYSPNGDSLWSHRYPSSGTRGYAGDDIAYDPRGFIYVVTRSNGNNDTVLKYDLEGNLIWHAVYITNHTFATAPPRLALDSAGNVYMSSLNTVAGVHADYIIVKFSPNGSMLWLYRYPGGQEPMSNEIFALAVDKSANVYVTGGSHACPPGEINYLTLKLSQDPTNVDEPLVVPTEYELRQNYPNPFNATTTIEFTLPRRGFVDLRIFDVLGREVAKLVEEERAAGVHRVQWHADDFSSGVYLCRLSVDNHIRTRKLLLLR